MADLIKRLHYFTNEFLLQEDFTAEQVYHMNMRRLHNKLFHGFGIGSGLVVSRSADREVRVTAGTAIDRQGREIVLVEDFTYPLQGSTPTLYLYIVYVEKHRDEDRYVHGSVSDNTRWTEEPLIQESPNPPPDDGNNVVLARISLSNGIPATINSIDTTVAPRAAVSAIGSDAIGPAQLADDSVTSDAIAAGAVGEGELANGAVTHDKLAPDAVQGDRILNQTITNNKLAGDAVQGNVIKDATIGFGKLAIVGTKNDSGTALAPGDSRDFTLTVDSAVPQLLLVSVRPSTLGGQVNFTQKMIARQSSSGNQKTDYVVTVRNVGGADVDFTIRMQTIAAA
jgi:hypothetical protein